MHPKIPFLERRLEPSTSPLLIIGTTILSILLALFIGGFLFLPFMHSEDMTDQQARSPSLSASVL